MGVLSRTVSIYSEAINLLVSRGDTLWLPGVGPVSGITPGNYLDSAGTIPATLDNPIGRVVDPYGGLIALQDTTANKPLLTKRVNLLTKSEDFTDAAWAKFDNNVTGNQAVAPSGSGADLLVPKAIASVKLVRSAVSLSSLGITAAVNRMVCKAAGYTRVQLVNSNTGNADSASAFFELAGAGVKLGAFVTGAMTATQTMKDLGNGWYECILRSTNAAGNYATYFGATAVPNTVPLASGFANFTGDGVSGALFADAHASVGTFQKYQRVNTANDYDTTDFPYLWRFDTTDSLAAALGAGYGAATIIDAAPGGQVTLTGQALVSSYTMSGACTTYGRILCKTAPPSNVLAVYQAFANALAGV